VAKLRASFELALARMHDQVDRALGGAVALPVDLWESSLPADLEPSLLDFILDGAESVGTRLDVELGRTRAAAHRRAIAAWSPEMVAAVKKVVTQLADDGFSRTQISDALKDGRLGPAHAETMALTEGLAATWQGRLAGWKTLGATGKRWVTMHDDRVRDTHVPLHGTTIALSALFRVGDGLGQGPVDPQLPVGERINCRCRLEPVFSAATFATTSRQRWEAWEKRHYNWDRRTGTGPATDDRRARIAEQLKSATSESRDRYSEVTRLVKEGAPLAKVKRAMEAYERAMGKVEHLNRRHERITPKRPLGNLATSGVDAAAALLRTQIAEAQKEAASIWQEAKAAVDGGEKVSAIGAILRRHAKVLDRIRRLHERHEKIPLAALATTSRQRWEAWEKRNGYTAGQKARVVADVESGLSDAPDDLEIMEAVDRAFDDAGIGPTPEGRQAVVEKVMEAHPAPSELATAVNMGDDDAFADLLGDAIGGGPVAVAADGSEFYAEVTEGSSGHAFGSILKNATETVGRFERRFDFDEDGALVAHHEYLELNSDVQGQGIASELNARLERMYREQGVDRIEVHANISVGGYAWARAGYDWDWRNTPVTGEQQGLLQSFVSNIEVAANRSGIDVSAEIDALRDRVRDGDYPTPFELSSVGWTDGAETWPGKEGLVGQSWYGVKHLVPED